MAIRFCSLERRSDNLEYLVLTTKSYTRISIYIGFTILVSACTSTAEKRKEIVFQKQSEFKDTINELAGFWLNEAYFSQIMIDGSPRNAQDGASFIEIPERTMQPTTMIFSFHEGGGELVFVKANGKYELREMHGDSLSNMLRPIKEISDSEIKLGDESFIKIKPEKEGWTYKILEEILFAGQYSSSADPVVIFNKNGKVSGLSKYKYYQPILDYYDAGMQIDQIGLGITKEDFDWFGFRWTKDTLQLFERSCVTFDSINNQCVEVEFGKLAFELTQKRSRKK